MNTTDLVWNTSDGVRLSGCLWDTESLPKAVICLVHGLGEHIGRYQHVAQFFTQRGLAVFGFDQRGHGKSGNPKGYNTSFDKSMGDIDLLLQKASARYPGVPVFLYGHSMGGMEVLNYAIMRQPKNIAGVIATSPGLRVGVPVPAFKRKLAEWLSSIYPTFTMANGLERAAISRDLDIVDRYGKDPLVHDRISARLGWDILTRGEWAIQNAEKVSLPVLLVQGSADRIVSPQGAIEFKERSNSFVSLKVWEGLYHETHNEPEQEAVLSYTFDWIQHHLPTG